MTIGERLRELRGDKTQAVVARDLMISASALSSYETNERVPRDDVKERIANYYGTTVQDIFFSQK
ncbi:helix-turn-helix transcriptional regulator [Hornefia butyriciproducens]|uniref:helix-turn-helix transcriptional regulator n=1 Tax=Hornefia butyriciproducens TaxID=2652293 RepID=UPI002A91330F|nr:helix-turn-helix transcriptional regulator [Hornefia butyriciproducens]MDY5463211.1 helix-turn-helix transcriptional regulator [Hornefia butyriciproducens]